MAAQKQAKRRQAVSAKKRAGHGNNRGRSAIAADAPAPALAKTASNGVRVNESAAATTADPVASGPQAPLGTSLLTWMRTHPLAVTTWVLSLIGVGVSIYLTITHYDTAVTIACSDKGVVNCEKVTTSPQSMVFGVFPVAVLGLAFYAFMAVINSPLGWRFSQAPVRWLRLGSVIVGMGFVLYLVFAEVIQIGNICLWCTSVHIITFLIFVLLVYDATSWGTSNASYRR